MSQYKSRNLTRTLQGGSIDIVHVHVQVIFILQLYSPDVMVLKKMVDPPKELTTTVLRMIYSHIIHVHTQACTHTTHKRACTLQTSMYAHTTHKRACTYHTRACIQHTQACMYTLHTSMHTHYTQACTHILHTKHVRTNHTQACMHIPHTCMYTTHTSVHVYTPHHTHTHPHSHAHTTTHTQTCTENFHSYWRNRLYRLYS